MKLKNLTAAITVAMILALVVGGCAARSVRHRSSVVDYLYPHEGNAIHPPEIPVLSLPLRVGVAFVPEAPSVRTGLAPSDTLWGTNHQRRSNTSPDYQGFSEKDKTVLMKRVSEHFKEFPFVKSIELIPSAYLRAQGSFANLDQLKTMFGIDVIALLSYDQVQFTDEDFASITYWTLIGAYLVKGEHNDTHTMLDAAVYDIASRKMLFRAPGVSHIPSVATPVNLTEQSRLDSYKGFQDASEDLAVSLKEQLEDFHERVKESPDDYQIVRKPGYVGAGYLGVSFLPIIVVLGGHWLWMLQSRKLSILGCHTGR